MTQAKTARSPRARGPATPFVVAIDGPAGAGKSTVARGTARALGMGYLDTGAMYRALTARALAEGIDPADGAALGALARRTDIRWGPEGLTVDGQPTGRELRSRRVSRAVSAVSAHPAVRREMVRVQRAMLRHGDMVAEGRDIGTVVFPRAPVKVFLTASIHERARRRHKEMAAAGDAVQFSTLKREIARRDALDSTRQASPLAHAADAALVDSTGKSPRQVVAEIVSMARAAGWTGERRATTARARAITTRTAGAATTKARAARARADTTRKARA
jgi:cytidylate kinase